MNLPNLHPDAERVLKGYQVTPARQLLRALQQGTREWGYPGGVDLSDVGTGKSFIDTAAAVSTGKMLNVLCPSVGISGWENTLSKFGARTNFIGTYEAVRGNWRPEVGKAEGRFFRWRNPADIILILDEAQIVKGQNTLTTAMVGGAIIQNIPIIAASATLATSPTEMRIAGRITGLHKGGASWKEWLLAHGCFWSEEDQRWVFRSRRFAHVMDEINDILIPERGCRVRKADLGERPPSIIEPLGLEVPEGKKLSDDWKKLNEKIEWMEQQEDDAGRPKFTREAIVNTRRAGRTKIWRAAEMALVPAVADRIKQCLNEGKSVVVFFSYTESRLRMAKIFNTTNGFYGGQNKKLRKKIEAEFQANRIHLLLCNIGAGGASISLHDTTGERPRETFIFPTDNAVKMGQAPGRVDRLDVMTPSRQWIPFVKGSMMEAMIKQTAEKLRRMSKLNDGDGQQKLAA